MTTQKERDTYEKYTKEIILDACGKDPFAIDYLWNLMCISRTVDDLYDKDQKINHEQVLEAVRYLLVELPFNPFFSKHRDTLMSQHVSMYNAWMAANTWEKGDETEQIYGHVWRDTHHEVVPLVALLTQGPSQMDFVSQKIRKLFKKNLGE
jgi:hypothetical protein